MAVKKGIALYVLMIALAVTGRAFAQEDTLLFRNDSICIYRTSASYSGNTLYDAGKDLQELIKKEEDEDCKVDYSFYYNPLSLIGNYYSYESGEGGIIACGVPSNTISVQTVDLRSGKEISLTHLFTEKSILEALATDPWIKKIGKEIDVDFSEPESFKEFIATLNQLGYARFSSNGFAILKYQEERNKVAVRLVGEAYMGFNHSRHLQIGLWLEPTAAFKAELKSKTHFMLGKFKNGLTN